MKDKPIYTLRIHHKMSPHYSKPATTNLPNHRRFWGIIVVIFVETPVVVNFPVTIYEAAIAVYIVKS